MAQAVRLPFHYGCTEMKFPEILVVDDEKNILKMIGYALEAAGYTYDSYLSPTEALEAAGKNRYRLAFIDLKMAPINGIELLREIKKISSDTTVTLMTAFSSIETAVDAMRQGAYNYITKPFNHKEFLHYVDKAREYHHLNTELKTLRALLPEMSESTRIVGKSKALMDCLKIAGEVAKSDFPVLIEGENGTGKELLARIIHTTSPRVSSRFIAVNCAAIPENLFESEVFGHKKGAFTGAVKDRTGRFELADGGTLFLDEVAELPPYLQVKLLRFLQYGEFERVGDSQLRKVNVRIIAATNRNTQEEMRTGNLREDFYYRLSAMKFTIPALRDRSEDIPELVEYLLSKYAPEVAFTIEESLLSVLRSYSWPGNIRELENVVKRLLIMNKDNTLRSEDLPPEFFRGTKPSTTLQSLEELERNHISVVLNSAPTLKDACQILGISEATLWRKRRLYNL